MISKRLNQLQIYATRIDGVDMRQPGTLQHVKEAGWVPIDFNFSQAQEVAYRPAHGMGSILGTLGCASAHFKAHAQVMADGMPLAVVFEDDSWPSDDFVERLWSMVHVELPCDWDVVSLYSRCPYGSCVSEHLLRVQPDINEPAWRCRQGVNWGMQAILYRTESLSRIQIPWKRTVFNESRPHCMDVDVALASISDEVRYYAVPSVQDPGFVHETDHPSLRWGINRFAATSSTTKIASSMEHF
jgi:GR25 family glycosyltransferase involved in LPS biosynthesis